MRSLGDVLASNRGIGPGFDTLRLLLAILILCWHSILVSYGVETDLAAWQGPLALVAGSLLPMFFALSGFLVMGSALRTDDLRRFITLRALRIVPALATEITLSALVLGTTFTTLPLWDYVTNREFFAYFGSLIGRIRVSLPGVFETNPYPEVINVSLWTITPELLCYVLLSLLVLTSIFKRKIAMTVLVAALACAYVANDVLQSSGLLLERRPSPQVLLLSFAFGNLLYLWKDRIPFSGMVFGVCLFFGLLFVRIVGLSYVGLLCLAYCIVYLGLTPLPKIPVLSKGDYSYGIYLYAFPMQQLVTHLLPDMREWYWNIVLALPLTIMIAMVSWTFVEKPALGLRKRLAASDRAGAHERSHALTFLLMFALLAYGLFLMWYANMVHKTQSLTVAAIALVTLLVISGISVGVMAGWHKRLLSLRVVNRLGQPASD